MRQFFTDRNIQIERQNSVRLEGKDFHHLARVLRARQGEKVLLVDSSGHRYESVVEELVGDHALLSLGRPLPDLGPRPLLRLCLCPPKGKAWDQALDAATQLGAREIWPVMSRRVVVRWDGDSWAGKAGRFERLLVEAAAQCNRAESPLLVEPMTFEDALQKAAPDLNLLAWEESKKPSLGLLEEQDLMDRWINLWIGPEGGFDPGEARALQEAGALHFSLGQSLLRVPVAVAAGLSLIYATWEEQR